MLTSLGIALWIAAAAAAGATDPPPRPQDIRTPGLYGAVIGADAAKAGGDTLVLMGPHGSGAPLIGTFENAGGGPDWNGWTSVDETAPAVHWQASTYQPVAGGWSAWCGDMTIPPCNSTDPAGGYGFHWDEMIEWRGAVADPAAPCTVRIRATATHDSETGYDYSWLSCEKTGGMIDLWSATGVGDAVPVDETTVYTPADYMDGNQVVVLFRFTSDGAWSDEDCLWNSAGPLRVDDVTITLSNGAGVSTGFEDGTLAPFAPRPATGVGDFAKLWQQLGDLDPCVDNPTWQVAFIDDGLVVPGTGGTDCVTWCYGPEGYVVNHTGGLLGPAAHLNNSIVSPPIPWQDPAHNGALLSFTTYLHENLELDFSGIFHTWTERFTTSPDPADLENQLWSDTFLYFADPGYYREQHRLDNYYPPNCTWVQIKLGVYDLGWIWGWDGTEASPAPYFDNVRFETYAIPGPSLSTREGYQANDGFPAAGTVDLVDLGSNSVRFDMAMNIAPAVDMRNDPGDSVVISVWVRAGATLVEPPRLHYKLFPNPVFDSYRTSGLPNTGSVACTSVHGGSGSDTYWTDLPDTGFIFPGDVLHWYFEASDDRGGQVGTAILPADTTGFSLRHASVITGWVGQRYDDAFTMRALPSVRDSGGAGLSWPTLLFWHDSGTDADKEEWLLGYDWYDGGLVGEAFDTFHTKEARNGLGNGLGGRATLAQLDLYTDIVYTSGDMDRSTLANGDFNDDPSQDLQLLDAWLRLGGRDLFLSGNELARDLTAADGGAFLGNWAGVDYVAPSLAPLVGGQTTPTAASAGGNPVLTTVSSWLVYGAGCLSPERTAGLTIPGPYAINAVAPRPGTTVLAQYLDPGGAPVTSLAALTLQDVSAYGARVIMLPADFALVWTDPDEPSHDAAARSRLLGNVLSYFGVSWYYVGEPTEVPAAGAFAVTSYPNPFNSATTIHYAVDRPGRLSLKVYDVRGRLVRTLLDGPVVEGGEIRWDGADGGGRQVASGVYFYEARLNGQVRVGKLTLVQ